MSVRSPVVSGSFYPAEKMALEELLSDIRQKEHKKIRTDINCKRIIGGIVPHAGYAYSGYEATHFFELLKNTSHKVDTFIIIHPDHFGMGKDLSADGHDQWETPLGRVPVDVETRALLSIDHSKISESKEHSAEVLLPFLQYFLDYEFRILPISMKNQSYGNASKLTHMLTEVIQNSKKEIMVIASSDFSHYVKPEIGFYNDGIVIDRITNFDPRGLYDAVTSNNFTICGFGPIVTLMRIAQSLLDNPKVEILTRGNSGKTHPADLVVDYVSALFFEEDI